MSSALLDQAGEQVFARIADRNQQLTISAYLAATNSGTVASLSYSSSVRCTKPAAMFSSRCSTEPVPGMGSMMGDRRSSHANATCLEVT